MFDFSGNRKRTQHCGIIVEVTQTHVVTSEANTSEANDANGGMVMRRIRNQRLVAGACRPNYPD